MSVSDDSLHDFPDRAIRKLLEDPANLRELIATVLPALVDRFDFTRVEMPPRTFLLDDWRQRESDMLQSAGEWLATLAVVRAERGEAAAFREVFTAVLRRLQALSDREPTRWHELLQFVLAWGLRRRPGEEKDPLLQAARRSHRSARQRAEIQQMADVILKSRDQEMLEQGELRGARRTLRMLLA